MVHNLLSENNLRGYTFEHTSKMLLRRKEKNNFIFVTNQFDSLYELCDKYRLKTNKIDAITFDCINNNLTKFDIIHFKLNNKIERIVENIKIYDVKTKYYKVKRDYFEFCKGSYDFFKKCQNQLKIDSFIISIILLNNWEFSSNVIPFYKVKKRVYSRFSKK